MNQVRVSCALFCSRYFLLAATRGGSEAHPDVGVHATSNLYTHSEERFELCPDLDPLRFMSESEILEEKTNFLQPRLQEYLPHSREEYGAGIRPER